MNPIGKRSVYRNTWLYLLVVLVLVALLLAACGGGEEEAATETVTATEAPRQVPSLPAGGTVVANGILSPVKFIHMTAPLSGEVSEVLVEEGQQVSAGDVLLRLKVDEQLRAELASAEYEKLQAQQALDDLTNKHNEAVTKAHDEYAKARQAHYDAERKAGFQATESTTFTKQQSDLELAVAKEKLDQAEARYELLQAGPDPVDLKLAQGRVANAEARLRAAQAAIQSREITAPMAGTVAEAAIEVGEQVNPGQQLFTIADFSTWQIETDDLNEIEVVKIGPGQIVTVVPDALPDVQLTGAVQSVSAVSEERSGDVTYKAIITLSEAVDPRMRWGMTMAVTFEK